MPANKDLLQCSAPPALPPRNPYRNRYHEFSALQFLRSGDNTKEILNNSQHYDPSEPSCYFKKCFDMGNVLGGGSFGLVIEAICKSTGRRFAVKLSKKKFHTPSERRYMMKELRRFEMIPTHPNILKLYSAWQEACHLCIQTEFCVSPLSIFCRSPLFTKPALLHCSLDVIRAVDHIHTQGLIHVDIKPENVLVTEAGICKLADFGASYLPQEDKDAQDGDCRYLSQDVLNSVPCVMSDVFSLGMTLFEISTQWELPLNGDHWNELRTDGFIERILNERCPELAELIGSAVRYDPKARASINQLMEAMERLCSLYERPQLTWEWNPPPTTIPSAFSDVLPIPSQPILATPPSTPPPKMSPGYAYVTPDFILGTPRAVQSERKPVRPIRLNLYDE